MSVERAQAAHEEVKKLLEAGVIREVQFSEWLSNPVLIKKANSKWRMCIDFTALNKACPRDRLPLPHIDQLVNSTAGCELLSFLDAYSGYHQVWLHPEDEAKTSFVTLDGVYCTSGCPLASGMPERPSPGSSTPRWRPSWAATSKPTLMMLSSRASWL